MKSSIGPEKNAAFTTGTELASSTATSNVVGSTTFVVNLRRKIGAPLGQGQDCMELNSLGNKSSALRRQICEASVYRDDRSRYPPHVPVRLKPAHSSSCLKKYVHADGRVVRKLK